MTLFISETTKQKVLEANISCIRRLLDDAAFASLKAQIGITSGSANEAIGWLLDIEPLLANAKALFDATLVIHRQA